MLVEKEVIRPGTYFYVDEQTKLPKKLVATPELVKYWHDQGNEMLSDRHRLPIPVPKEHDFSIHPMTPAEKLDNNAGWVKEYRLKGDTLFSVLDIQDEEYAKKLPKTIRWTSPWINSFTDGKGKQWNNVISHLALTTRPRIVDQQPFSSIAAALSMATETIVDASSTLGTGTGGLCLSSAGLLGIRKADKVLAPRYPVAFSLLSGISLSDDNFNSKKKKSSGGGGRSDGGKKPKKPESGGGKPDQNSQNSTSDGDDDTFGEDDDTFEEDGGESGGGENFGAGEKSGGNINDVSMEELLCDLLGALGIHCEHSGNEEMFKRELYNAAMTKIHELAGKGQQDPSKPQGNRANPPGQPPNNPLMASNVQQEQQPMYMGLGGAMEFSLEEINKLPDPMKGVALAMYNENVKATTRTAELEKKLNSLNDAKLKEEKTKRDSRVSLLGRLSPRVKADLDAMVAMPSMALSMGDGGAVLDPMEQTLAVLEKGLADMPRLLTTDRTALSVADQPQDADVLTDARADEIADSLARQMGCGPTAKAS